MVQDEQGRADFGALRLAIERESERLVFYAFDLVHLDGHHIRAEPLRYRCDKLRKLIGSHNPDSVIQFRDSLSDRSHNAIRVRPVACGPGRRGAKGP